jgi:hypothetical protein
LNDWTEPKADVVPGKQVAPSRCDPGMTGARPYTAEGAPQHVWPPAAKSGRAEAITDAYKDNP